MREVAKISLPQMRHPIFDEACSRQRWGGGSIVAIALFKPTQRISGAQYYHYECTGIDVETKAKWTKNVKVPVRYPEKPLDSVQFRVFKFNNRPKPKDRRRVLIIGCFSEFGCETVGTMYCIPRLVQKHPGLYIIAMGWYGREYLYRNLVDEFWEIDESCMWLRDYCRAFHHLSTNLKRIEEGACQHGVVVPSAALGRYVVGNSCRTCGKFWNDWKTYAECCPACQSTVITRSVFSDIKANKAKAVLPKPPSTELKAWAKSFLKPNSVGVFARGRKTYGRNLTPEFYVKLIERLEARGYNVVWLGEKQNCLPCPVKHVLDFSQMPEARDLERTLAIISCLCFTVQFWTASTRLSGMVGTPFLLFESPDQIYSTATRPGQEGRRLELTSFGPKKLCLSHYERACGNFDETLNLVDKCIDDMREGNFSDVLGLVGDLEAVTHLKDQYYEGIR